MSGRRAKGKRYRLPCIACQTKLDLAPEAKRLVGYLIPGGDAVVLVCDEKCEQTHYANARLMNWLLSGEPVAMHSDAIIRHDLAVKHGKVGIREGKIVYIDAIDKPEPRE